MDKVKRHRLKDTCEHCRYFWGLNGEATGICRRAPPTFIMAIDQDGNPMQTTNFPEVSRETWCGEYRDIGDKR